MAEFRPDRTAILLNSGGPDCFLAAERFSRAGWTLHSLYVPLSKLSNRAQNRAAKRTAKMFCKSHTVAKRMNDWATGLGTGKQIVAYPHTLTYVHFLGSMYASYVGADYVLSGLKPSDIRHNFLDELSDLMSASTMTIRPLFIAPYMYEELYDSDEDALNTHHDLGRTHSCFYNKPCGTCAKCKRRERLGIIETPWYKFWSM